MNVDQIESPAFRSAALKSESYRIIGMLSVIGIVLLYAIARGLVARQFWLLFALVLTLAFAVAVEAATLFAVKKALKENHNIPPVLRLFNVFVETQLPTITLLLLIESGFIPHGYALVTPAALLYFLIISLSTLRLSPTLSLGTALLSALGYFAVFAYTTQAEAPLPVAFYILYGTVILMGGVVAAFVAREIRDHVMAALREAELHSKLERVKHDLDVARTIQQGLLPTQSPTLDNFELAGWNQPADQTGGDYFDWQPLPNGLVAISLADATGHGIGPALVSASCRAYARASFLNGNGQNGQNGLLDRLNRLLAEDLSSNRFVTFAVVFLDPSVAQIKVLSAGHGPIIWYRYATDTIENLEAQGIPLGMMAGFKYEHGNDRHLEPGDMLILVTDGFYEWENPEGEEFGMSRLEDVIRTSRDHSANEIIERLRAAVKDFCRGTEQKDDLTAVVLKRRMQA
jgi:serine phosphatase RsbU (regulator of sigma subunit)